MRERLIVPAVGMLLLAATLTHAACNPEPHGSPTPVKHLCGHGPVTVTVQSEIEKEQEKPTTCAQTGSSGLKAVGGATYSSKAGNDITLLTTSSNMLYYYSGSAVRVYTRLCEQDFSYTDWPECGGEKQYPAGLRHDAPPQVESPTPCKCNCEPHPACCECQ